MSNTDRIEQVLRVYQDRDLGDPEVRQFFAAKIDAELHPVIETVDQLDALPFLTIIREVYGPAPSGNDYGAVWERRTGGWHCIAGAVMSPGYTSPRLGCRVLYTPEADR